MHRIPLQLPIPSIRWERTLPECILFENTLNLANFEETQTFIKTLDEEADFYQKKSYEIVEEMFWKARKGLSSAESSSFAEGMLLISWIILRAPKDSSILAYALKIRGQCYFHDSSLLNASKDYEMFLYVNEFSKQPTDDICEIICHLTYCMHNMQKYNEVKKYLQLYKEYKGQLSAESQQKKNFVQTDDLPEIMVKLDNALGPQLKLQRKTSSAIRQCSSDNTGNVIGKASAYDYQQADVVFVEDPMVKSINAPLFRCEKCFCQTKQQIYTCLECRYKTYCSLHCLQSDSEEHKLECIGYKQLLLLILDAGVLFRNFVKISHELDEKIFSCKSFGKYKTARDVWFGLLICLEQKQAEVNCSILSLLTMKPMYDRLTETQYSTLVTTAFRLAMFIDMKTNLIEKLFGRLQISDKQKLIVVGSMLMRIHCNLLLSTFDCDVTRGDVQLQYSSNMQQINSLTKNSGQKHQEIIEDLNQFYDIDVSVEVWDYSLKIQKSARKPKKAQALSVLQQNKHSQEECKRLHRILSIYKDKIAEVYFNPDLVNKVLYGPKADQPLSAAVTKKMCSRLALMTNEQRCYFVQRYARLFHNYFADYFMHLVEQKNDVPNILAVYSPSLKEFQHSCDPNVEVMIMTNGTLVGKALKAIKAGEQLYVSVNAHYMRHARKERQTFLKQLDLECQCEFCVSDNAEEPIMHREVIYCDSCQGVSISPDMKECPKCKTQYNELLTKHFTVINILENKMISDLENWQLNAINERDIYILHLIFLMHARKYFGPQYEFRIKIELKHARYLAYKNFIIPTYQLLMEIRKNIQKSYDEHSIWFTFYADMLQAIKIILICNIDDSTSIPPSAIDTLLKLCNFGVFIVKGQLNLIDFYEVFDSHYFIFNDMELLLQCRNKIARKQNNFSTCSIIRGSWDICKQNEMVSSKALGIYLKETLKKNS
uniref:MYND-type domain-containing protein n=1 Tax=Stomoxys calcitrans TaxID=35570 RepID=A0A1I8PS07_STOCA